jgi:type VI secretion system Hcp family effector
MKRFIAMTITVFALCGSTLATGDVNITIDSKQGQIRTTAKEFRYSQSPRDLAGQSTSMAAAGQATSARGASAARAGMRRASEPIVVVRYLDEASKFFVSAAANGELLPAVLFEFKRASGSGQPEVFQTVRLTNATVSSVKTINGGDRPMEEVSFTFQKIEYNHRDGAAAARDNWNTK